MALSLISVGNIIVVRVVPASGPAPAVPAAIDLPAAVDFGTCEDCGGQLDACCSDPDCGRVFCESCEFGSGV